MILDHVAILVEDLGRSTQFYSKILELPVARILETQDAKTVFVNAGNAMVSLSEVKRDKVNPPSTEAKDIGLRSLSFRVQNVEEAWRELLRRGVIFTSSPEKTEGGYKRAAFTDPNGIALELVEYPGP